VKDAKTLENVQNFERVVSRHLEKGDYDTAVDYIDQIIQECVSSESHAFQKLEYLLKASKLSDAFSYSQLAA
jgi:hypothetical protein